LIAPGKPRIGIGKVKYRDYYDFNCDHGKAEAGHIIDHTLKLLTAFGIDSETVSGYAAPFLDKSSLEKIGRYLREITDRSPNLLKIGFNLSAGSSTRLWDEQKSVELLRRILQSCQDSEVILFTVPQERRRGESLHSHFAERTNLLPEALDLREVAALISKLDVFITPDTSLVHIARSFRVPVVGLYCGSKNNFQLWRPYGQEVGAVMSSHDDNIFDITVDQVFDTFVCITQQLSPVGR
jgi:ADP-heptose:LPS heptosyltransferase